MKIFMILILGLASLSAYANPNLEAKIKQLEMRVQALESQLGSQKTQSGLRVKDLGNQNIMNRNISSTGAAANGSLNLTKEQEKEMMEAIEKFKKAQEKNQKLLDELMNEDF